LVAKDNPFIMDKEMETELESIIEDLQNIGTNILY
jgi:hypothetical protein